MNECLLEVIPELNLLAIPYPHQNEQNWAGIEIH
jgi:hypothetical protein